MSKPFTSCAMRGDNKCHKHECCNRPAPTSRADMMRKRNQIPSNVDLYSTECYSCNHICRCEAPQLKSDAFKIANKEMNSIEDNDFQRTRGEN